jgi:peroxiredoxin family protein
MESKTFYSFMGMTVDMMELDEEKLIEGVIVWTAEDFLKYAKDCKICLFT